MHRHTEREPVSNSRTRCRVQRCLPPWLPRWQIGLRADASRGRVYERVQVSYVIHFAGKPVQTVDGSQTL